MSDEIKIIYKGTMANGAGRLCSYEIELPFNYLNSSEDELKEKALEEMKEMVSDEFNVISMRVLENNIDKACKENKNDD